MGCKTNNSDLPVVSFDDIYTKSVDKYDYESDTNFGKALTFSCVDMPLTQFLRWLSNTANVSVVCQDSIDQASVTVDLIDQDINDVLNIIARRLGVQVTRTGNLYFIGKLRREDRGVLVRTVKRLAQQELESSVTSILSDSGRVVAMGDGLVVVADSVEVLQRVHELLDGIESAPNNSWVVQLFVVNYRSSDDIRFGAKVDTSAEVGYSFAQMSNSSNDNLYINGAFRAVLQAERDRKDINLVARPMFVLRDGGRSVFSSGERVPIPKKSVSDQGVVSTIGFDYIQTGLSFKIELRETGVNSSRLSLDVDISDVVGYVENAPITNSQKFMTKANIKSCGVYLLGSIQRDNSGFSRSGFFPLNFESEKLYGLIQIWAKAYRISEIKNQNTHNNQSLPHKKKLGRDSIFNGSTEKSGSAEKSKLTK